MDDVPPLPDHDSTLDHDNPAWNIDGAYQSATADLSNSGLPHGLPTHGLEALSAAASQDQYSAMGPPTTESTIARNAITYAQSQLSPNTKPPPAKRRQRQRVGTPPDTANKQLSYLVGSPNNTSPPIDPNLQPSVNGDESFLDPALAASDAAQAVKGETSGQRDQEVAFLLRHFSETPGQ